MKVKGNYNNKLCTLQRFYILKESPFIMIWDTSFMSQRILSNVDLN